MEPGKRKSRISSLFSISSTTSDPENPSVTSFNSASRLDHRIRGRVSSLQNIVAPSYPPPPPPPKEPPTQGNPLMSVETAPAALEPPPPISSPGSRSASPARSALSSRPNSRSNSRPTTPLSETGGATSRLAPEKIKRLKRKSRIFRVGGSGGGSSSDERLAEPNTNIPAWIVGHHSKVPYNLTALVNGEQVSFKKTRHMESTLTRSYRFPSFGTPRATLLSIFSPKAPAEVHLSA